MQALLLALVTYTLPCMLTDVHALGSSSDPVQSEMDIQKQTWTETWDLVKSVPLESFMSCSHSSVLLTLALEHVPKACLLNGWMNVGVEGERTNEPASSWVTSSCP